MEIVYNKSNINQNFLESLMNKESLKYLPKLVEDMDENLGFNIEAFLANPIIKPFNFESSFIIDAIKNSKDFHYDKKAKTIRIKKKPDLNLILFPDFTFKQEKKNKEDKIKNQIDFIKETILLSIKTLNYNDKSEKKEDEFTFNILSNLSKEEVDFSHIHSNLKRIQFNENIKSFQIVFDSEYYANLAYEFFSKLNNQEYFHHYLATMNETEESKINFKLINAAETLKKRILREFLPSKNALSETNQINFIKYILLNPDNFSINDFISNNHTKPVINNEEYDRPKLDPSKIYMENELIALSNHINQEIGKRIRNNSMNNKKIPVNYYSKHKFSFHHANDAKEKEKVQPVPVYLNEKEKSKRNSGYLQFNSDYTADKRNSFSQNKNKNEKSLIGYINSLNYFYDRNGKGQSKGKGRVYTSQSKMNKFDMNFGYDNQGYEISHQLTGNSCLRKFSKREEPVVVNNNNEANIKTSKHKLSNIIIPKEHKFSCNYIDHKIGNKNVSKENERIVNLNSDNYSNYTNPNSNPNKIVYSSESMVGIFVEMLSKANFELPDGFKQKSNENIFFEIGIPLPKKLEHLRVKKLSTFQGQERKISHVNARPRLNTYYNQTHQTLGSTKHKQSSFYDNKGFSGGNTNKDSFNNGNIGGNGNVNSYTNSNSTTNAYSNWNNNNRKRIYSSQYEFTEVKGR